MVHVDIYDKYFECIEKKEENLNRIKNYSPKYIKKYDILFNVLMSLKNISMLELDKS